jgi:SepF-like predicted cell division protein (DUF552 family)
MMQEDEPGGIGEFEVREETVSKAEDQVDVKVVSPAGDQDVGELRRELREDTPKLKRTNKLDLESEDSEDIKRQIQRLKRAFDKKVYD